MNGQKNAFILASCGFVLAFGIAATVVLPAPPFLPGKKP